MKISICIPTFNRFEMCLNSFRDVVYDDRVDDIVIIDDNGSWDNHECLRQNIDMCYGWGKIKLKKQLNNRGMSINKKDAISFSKNEWALILDDDNKVGPDYLDALFAVPDVFADNEEIFLPDFAAPDFDFRHLSGQAFNRKNVLEFFSHPTFGALLNCCNYVVNRDFYLETWVHNPEMKATDTAWHALNHLKRDGGFYIVPGMRYEHRVHSESGFLKDVHYNMAKAKEIENLIKAL